MRGVQESEQRLKDIETKLLEAHATRKTYEHIYDRMKRDELKYQVNSSEVENELRLGNQRLQRNIENMIISKREDKETKHALELVPLHRERPHGEDLPQLDDPVGIWSLGGSILAPFFSGGRLEGQFDAATAQRDQAAFAYQRTVLTAFREVEDQLVLIDRLGEQERALVAQREAVADALRHATNRYRAGYSPYLEQIDAQRALLSVELAILQVLWDRGAPCTVREVHEALSQHKDTAYTTVLILNWNDRQPPISPPCSERAEAG